MKILAFNGSPRPQGNTAQLLQTALAPLEAAGASVELVQIGGDVLRGCTACLTCRKLQNRRCVFADDIVNDCIAKMIDADGILIGSPTYFANVTTETKALIDRAGYVLRGNGNLLSRKVGAAVVAVRRAGSMPAVHAIHDFFLISDMIVPGSTYWNLGIGRGEGDVQDDQEGLNTMHRLGENLLWLLQNLHQSSGTQ